MKDVCALYYSIVIKYSYSSYILCICLSVWTVSDQGKESDSKRDQRNTRKIMFAKSKWCFVSVGNCFNSWTRILAWARKGVKNVDGVRHWVAQLGLYTAYATTSTYCHLPALLTVKQQSVVTVDLGTWNSSGSAQFGSKQDLPHFTIFKPVWLLEQETAV